MRQPRLFDLDKVYKLCILNIYNMKMEHADGYYYHKQFGQSDL